MALGATPVSTYALCEWYTVIGIVREVAKRKHTKLHPGRDSKGRFTKAASKAGQKRSRRRKR